MKKKLLFVIPSLGAGGAEKSLVNLLNTIDENLYSVDLFLFTQDGLFLNQLPQFVKILPQNKLLEIFQKPLLNAITDFVFRGQFSLALNRLRFAQIQRLTNNRSVSEQYSWKYKCKAIKELPNQYDAAIGFLEKSSIYFTVDKVKAFKKIGFIHTYYSKLHADQNFDDSYFSRLNTIISISEECSVDLKNTFPQFTNKVKIIHNIVSSKILQKLAEEQSESLCQRSIISVGRLVALKGFDLAIEAAKILKEKGINFQWYIIGEGEERKILEDLISKYNLQDCFHLLGIKQNPYPYIKQANVFVQPSRYEGKSISVDEAKILAKPIVLTNFTTSKNQIDNGYNGLIVDMNPSAIADGIVKYFTDSNFRDNVVTNLQSENFGTEKEIYKLYSLID